MYVSLKFTWNVNPTRIDLSLSFCNDILFLVQQIMMTYFSCVNAAASINIHIGSLSNQCHEMRELGFAPSS